MQQLDCRRPTTDVTGSGNDEAQTSFRRVSARYKKRKKKEILKRAEKVEQYGKKKRSISEKKHTDEKRPEDQRMVMED